jgi:AraC family transcriptional regulator
MLAKLILKIVETDVLAKIAVDAMKFTEERISNPPEFLRLSSADGWTASDVVCTAGPADRPFEEQHTQTSIAIVVQGTFQYRSSTGEALMTPGSLLLGNAGDCFTCGHEHSTGDRCLAFSYAPEFFERFADGPNGGRVNFKVPRLSRARALAWIVANASMLLTSFDAEMCEELCLQVATEAIRLQSDAESYRMRRAPSSLARITRVVRAMENDADIPRDLKTLAQLSGLSRYHFLRTFEELTGTTPHQYQIRVRLRRAAVRLRSEPTRISDIALECGFGDISNFNRTFRTEFGVNPRTFRSRV